MSEPIRYLLDSDDDGHWYLVPVDVHQLFREWVLQEQERDFPDGVTSLGSHPNTVTFEAPMHFGEPAGVGI